MAVFGVPADRQFHKKYKFVVEINGVASAAFQSMSELRAQVAVIEHHEGGSLVPSKQLGKVTFPNLTLRRGTTSDLDLFEWFQEGVAAGGILSDTAQKRTIDLVEQNRNGDELRRWTIVDAQPVEYSPGEWDNNVDENTMEEVILAYRYFEEGGD